ncbi:MAG TPA: FAD-dependent oxidoreductase [Pirellulaceae bacterium]|nr:FAD-dependent oxidoreductase [Pirellulaceae bacterium]
MRRCDIAVIGGGFAGSIMARVLASIGLDVMVFERQRHPRFAIGESSTPTADLVLESLCRRFRLDDLLPLCRYGSARTLAPEVIVGPKRGFTYVDAQVDPAASAADPSERRRRELLVAASESLEQGDTHWHRASVDAYLARSLAPNGVELQEGCEVGNFRSIADRWRFEVVPQDASVGSERASRSAAFAVEADGIIDASGVGSPFVRALGLKTSSDRFRTRSGAVFGHVEGWRPWGEVLDEARWPRTEHPFACDQAALHRVADDGWLWQLAFDSGVTSVGWCVAPEAVPSVERANDWWNERLARFPSIAAQASSARRIAPEGTWGVVPRMQFRRERNAGPNWWLLPSAAGFVDPLHSSGIAHALVVIERLGEHFAARADRLLPDARATAEHDWMMTAEIDWIDRLVGLGYRSMHDFREFTLASMPYFVAAIRFESLRAEDRTARPGFLAWNDPSLRKVIERFEQELSAWQATGGRLDQADDATFDRLAARLRSTLMPIDRAGLLDPAAHPYYLRSAAPTKQG